jgi:hypothetical protein
MENKYFTPDIEDLCIGYEYEKYSIGLQVVNDMFLPDNERDDELKWRPKRIESGSDIIHLEACSYQGEKELYRPYKILWKNYIRVPYLTKEQIEAEGWIDDTASFQKPELFVAYQNSSTWRKLVYRFSDNMLQIVEVDDSYIYSGNCKDINTFRKITKLLKI